MIIGKSLTALAGGLKPEIRVTAKAGALLNLHFKDSSIILQYYQLGAEETQHTFVVSVSETAYMIEDVTNSSSIEVLVDTVSLFNVEIPYRVYLYKNGNNYANFYKTYSYLGTTSVTFYDDYIELFSQYPNGGNGSQVSISTASKIDISTYKSIGFLVKEITGNGWLTQFGLNSGSNTEFSSKTGQVAYGQLEGSTFERTELILPINHVASSAYPIVTQNSGQQSSRYTRISEIWLE